MVDNELSSYIVPQCTYCGNRMIFELQLMPNLIFCMIVNKNKKSGGAVVERFDFGTVSIYSCPISCLQSDNHYYQEYIHVQQSM